MPTEMSSPARPSMFASLRVRNFRIFLTGQVISFIGGWTQRIAQDWLVLSLTGSATAVGITTAMQFLPTVLFGPFGGLLADRFPKRRVLLVTQSVLLASSSTLAALVVLGSVQVWHIYLLAAIFGAAVAVDNPTRQAFINEVVGAPQLRNAISLNSAAFQLGALVGPAVSGVLISTVGISSAFVVNAASFVVALGSLLLMRTDELTQLQYKADRRADRQEHVLPYMISRREIFWPTLMMATFAVFTTSYPVSLTSFASHEFDIGASGFAFLTCMLAVGSLCGSLLAARRGTIRLRSLIAMSSSLVVAQLVTSLAPGVVAFSGCLIAMGLFAVMTGVSANSTVQLASGDAIRGRVMGMYLLAVFGAGTLGGPLVGWINEQYGPRLGLGLGAVVPGIMVAIMAIALARAAGVTTLPVARERILATGGHLREALSHTTDRVVDATKVLARR